MFIIFINMKFIITESEKNEIRGLYNLNEQGFIDAFFGGVKSGEEKAIILRKNTYYIGFEEDINRASKEVDGPGHFTIISNQAEDIVGEGNTIKLTLQEIYGDKRDKREYNVIYNCSSDELKSDNGFVAYNGSMQTPDDLTDLKNEISKFCNV